MSVLKTALRNLMPHGIIEWRRRRFRVARLGIAPGNNAALEQAVESCHFDLWPEFLRANQRWTLLDVGANEGEFIRAAILLGKPDQIIAFEPQPACKPMLDSLMANVRGGKVIAAAVGATAGTIEFNCTGNSKMASVLIPQQDIERSYAMGDYEVVSKLTVPVVRLDDVVPAGTNIGLLKLDVQGYELEALRGASRVLTETKALLVEVNYVSHYKGAVEFDTLHRFLGDIGFRLHGVSAPFVDKHRPLWADAMYVRRSI